MLPLNTTKRLYALIFCTLLVTQQLKPTISDNTYNDAIVCLFFFGGCALCGLIASFFKKQSGTKTNIKHKKSTPQISQNLEKMITALESQTEKLSHRINKHDQDLPIEFTHIENKFTEQEEKIKKLEQQCNELTQHNILLLTNIESIKHGINGYVPAFVAALWFNKYTEQTKKLEYNPVEKKMPLLDNNF